MLKKLPKFSWPPILLWLMFLLTIDVKSTDIPESERKPKVENTAPHGRIIRNDDTSMKEYAEENKVFYRSSNGEIIRVEIPPVAPKIENQATDVEVKELNERQPFVTFDTRPKEVLLAEAKSLLTAKTGPYDLAMADLRSIILTESPENARLAHELLGYAYEKSLMYSKAKKEYGMYLSLYPEESSDRQRVKERLLSLEIMDVDEKMKDVSKDRKPHEGDDFTTTGSVSEYAMIGKSQLNSITGLNFNAKREHNQYVLSSAARFTYLKDFENSRGNRTNLSMAYVDFEDTFKRYNVRAGRQAPIAGAIGRFDGLSSRVFLNNDLAVTAALGSPYLGRGSDTSRMFYGTGVDWNVNPNLVVGAYINRETADNLLERSAVGTDVSFVNKDSNLMLRVEYDTLYHTLNSLSLQGMKYFDDSNIFLYYDHRKSPMPFADVALGLGVLNQGRQAYGSVGEMMNNSGLTSSDVYRYIDSSTPYASSLAVGGTRTVKKDWTATADFQMTNLSTTPGFTISPQFDPIPVQVGQDNSYMVNLHLRGDNVFAKGNSTEYVLSNTTGAIKSSALTFADSYRFGAENKSTVSSILRLDSYNRGYGTSKVISGTFRAIYNLGKGDVEAQYSKSLTLPSKSSDQNFYIGYRNDF